SHPLECPPEREPRPTVREPVDIGVDDLPDAVEIWVDRAEPECVALKACFSAFSWRLNVCRSVRSSALKARRCATVGCAALNALRSAFSSVLNVFRSDFSSALKAFSSALLPLALA